MLVPIPIQVYFLRPTDEDWAALPCGEVKLVRERIDAPVFAKKKEDKKEDNNTIDWDKMAKHIRE